MTFLGKLCNTKSCAARKSRLRLKMDEGNEENWRYKVGPPKMKARAVKNTFRCRCFQSVGGEDG